MTGNITQVNILILGGGIAGAGLAFNLRKNGFKGSIAIVENHAIGANRAYGYRSTFKEIIDKYDLEYAKVFSGLLDGIKYDGDIQWMGIDTPVYFYDYQKACLRLIEKSDVFLINDTAEELFVDESKIKFKENVFFYDVLVDCTGLKAWTRRKIGLSIPGKRYYGMTYVIPKDALKHKPSFYSEEKIIWYFRNDGYTEEIYAMPEFLIVGVWNYSIKTFQQIKIQPGGIFEKLGISDEISKTKGVGVVLPAEPSMPLIFKNIAYLGDCCGQATPATSEGTRPILQAAELLADVISNGKPLKEYQDRWVSQNLKQYVFHKVFKDNILEFNRFFFRLRKYPDVYRDLILNKFVLVPARVLIPSLHFILETLWKFQKEYRGYLRQISKAEKEERAR